MRPTEATRADEGQGLARSTPVRAPAQDASPTASPTPGDTPGLAPARIAPPMHLHYEVTGSTREGPVSGQAELAWQHDGQRYEARFEQAGTGLPRRQQRSAGQLTPQGLAPERFSQRARHEEAVHFERAAGRAVFSAHRPAVPLLAGAQDRLSLLLQLGARIAARPAAHPVGSLLEVQAATTRDALIWRFRVEAREELPLPGGQVSTLRLVRLPLGTFEPDMAVWLAPALDYAPVRLRLTSHAGDGLDYQWSGTDRR